jgi:hypothetical protein
VTEIGSSVVELEASVVELGSAVVELGSAVVELGSAVVELGSAAAETIVVNRAAVPNVARMYRLLLLLTISSSPRIGVSWPVCFRRRRRSRPRERTCA